jgi:hypothetical protein
MILDMVLSAGGDWQDTTAFKVTFQNSKRGYWECLNTYWINLLAYENNGNFQISQAEGTNYMDFYDGHNDEQPAFTLSPSPQGEWDHKHKSGFIYVMNPRNPWGYNLNSGSGSSTWNRR